MSCFEALPPHCGLPLVLPMPGQLWQGIIFDKAQEAHCWHNWQRWRSEIKTLKKWMKTWALWLQALACLIFHELSLCSMSKLSGTPPLPATCGPPSQSVHRPFTKLQYWNHKGKFHPSVRKACRVEFQCLLPACSAFGAGCWSSFRLA